jgi:DnaJ-class molecular chaperone
VDLVNALVGFETVIKHVDERDVKLSKPTVTSHGEVQRVKGQGMPKRTSGGGFGDLVVTWEVRAPGGGGEGSAGKPRLFRGMGGVI